jgi:carbon monoxide dehydrogenase subunit G
MLVNFNQTLTLAATQQDVWNLLRDTKRLAALIPGIETISPIMDAGPHEKHVARIVERIGPFRLSIDVEVRIVQAVKPSLLNAELSGIDSSRQNRLSGTLSAELTKDSSAETLLRMDSRVEVTGKLATLGAAPIRRRANELFAQFSERLQGQFSPAGKESTS